MFIPHPLLGYGFSLFGRANQVVGVGGVSADRIRVAALKTSHLSPLAHTRSHASSDRTESDPLQSNNDYTIASICSSLITLMYDQAV